MFDKSGGRKDLSFDLRQSLGVWQVWAFGFSEMGFREEMEQGVGDCLSEALEGWW